MNSLPAYAAEACRLYILAVLAAAVLGKAAGMDAFRDSVAGLSGLSGRPAAVAAMAVVGAEAAILAALLVAPRAGIAAATVMFASFFAAILVALLRRNFVVCNCFGGGSRPISRLDLVRNAAMVGACAFFLVSPPAAALAPLAWLLLLGAALIAFLVTTHLDEIAATAR